MCTSNCDRLLSLFVFNYYLTIGWNEASTVADLVTKAFAQPKENHHRKQSGSNLNTLEVETNEIKTSSNSNNDNDGVNSSSLLGNFLRIIGLNNGKLSALAINGLIFIAQMVIVFLLSKCYFLLNLFYKLSYISPSDWKSVR